MTTPCGRLVIGLVGVLGLAAGSCGPPTTDAEWCILYRGSEIHRGTMTAAQYHDGVIEYRHTFTQLFVDQEAVGRYRIRACEREGHRLWRADVTLYNLPAMGTALLTYSMNDVTTTVPALFGDIHFCQGHTCGTGVITVMRVADGMGAVTISPNQTGLAFEMTGQELNSTYLPPEYDLVGDFNF